MDRADSVSGGTVSGGGEAGRVDILLWAIVDRQAPIGARKKVRRLLGSDAAVRSALREYGAVDRSLRAWCEGRPVEIRPVDTPDPNACPARATVVLRGPAATEPSGARGA